MARLVRLASILAGLIPIASGAAPPSGYKQFSFDGGTLMLPIEWKFIERSQDGRFVFRAPGDLMQATISTVYATEKMNAAKRKTIFDQFLATRLQAEQTTAGASLTLNKPQSKELPGGTLIATYDGHDSSRQFSAQVAMKCDEIVVVYLEALDDARKGLGSVSKNVFANVALNAK